MPSRILRQFVLILVLLNIVKIYHAAAHSKSLSYHYQAGCSIYDKDLKLLKRYPGNFCVFLDDGSYYVSDLNAYKIKKIDSHGSVIWERTYPVHHSLSYFEEENLLVAITLETSRIRGPLAEFSSIVAFDVDGNVRHYFGGAQQQLKLDKKLPRYRLRLRTNFQVREPLWEDTHANAVYRIPKNILSQWHPAFTEGNFLVTLGRQYGIAIFDPTFTYILWRMDISSYRYIHDAQVTPDGKILYYQNAFNEEFNSRIEILDPVQRTLVWYYPKDTSMKAPAQGGTQLLENGNILYSDITNNVSRVVEVDPLGNLLKNVEIPEDPGNIQDVKAKDLSNFLKNSLL